MKCQYCGQTHDRGTKFCPNTGYPIGHKNKTGTIIFVVASLIIISSIVFISLSGAGKEILSVISEEFYSQAVVNLPGSGIEQSTPVSLNIIRKNTQTHTATVTLTLTPMPSSTLTPTITSTPTLTATNTVMFTPTQPYIDYSVNQKDNAGLVYVPEGEFMMGADSETDPYFWGSEGPSHVVYTNAFWIYQYEITNAMYAQCVAEKACPKPAQDYSVIAAEYYSNEEYSDYPVIYVTYSHALSYCRWAGGRLPYEAEWEKAARGTGENLFPWGNSFKNSNLANVCGSECARGEIRANSVNDGFAGPAPVGSFREGVSPYGAYDMAGNVWEWVWDWFQPTFYSSSPYENPIGPYSSSYRVIRGGSWTNGVDGVRTVTRYALNPSKSLDTLGFRCVVDE